MDSHSNDATPLVDQIKALTATLQAVERRMEALEQRDHPADKSATQVTAPPATPEQSANAPARNLEDGGLINAFEMIVSRLNTIEDRMTWLSRINADALPLYGSGCIKGDLFGVPFDIHKYTHFLDPSRGVYAVLVPHHYDPYEFASEFTRTPPARLRSAEAYEPEMVIFFEHWRRPSLEDVVSCVLEFLEQKKIDPGALDHVTIEVAESREMHDLFLAVNYTGPSEPKVDRIRKVVASICKDKKRGKNVRKDWHEFYCEQVKFATETDYQSVMSAFEAHLGAM